MAAHEIEEVAGVVTHFLAKLSKGDKLRLALAHGDFFATSEEADELNEGDLQAVARLAHGDEAGADARDVAMVVRAEHVDELGESQLTFFEVISDVGCEVGLLS